MKKASVSIFITLLISLALLFIFAQCTSEDEILVVKKPADSVAVKALSTAASCSTCKYIIPNNVSVVDAKLLGIKPGDVICFKAGTTYTNSITFRNIVGTTDLPVIVTNCGGNVVLTVPARPINVKFSYSKYFRFTGGSVDGNYGIKMSGSASNGLVLCDLSTNFEVDHIEISNVGFAGIMAKTDPTCDNSTNRGYFTMRNISIHDNYVHHTGGEGMYIGHSFYNGYTLSCGVRYPHLIENAKIYENKVSYSGWDGIQVGCAPKGTDIYKNTVENSGTKYKADQNYGIILSAGTGGKLRENYVKGGTGTGIVAFGHGDNYIYNNVVVAPANTGIFTDERTTTFGAGYFVMNNTIINPKKVGIRMYGDKVPKNVVINNIVVNPGDYATMGSNAYVMKLTSVTRIENSNNILTRNMADLKFLNAGAYNYRLTSGSPALNKGKSISTYGIPQDHYGAARLKGTYYDIGAAEY